MVGMRTEGGALDTVAVQALAANFAGHLLQPGHPGYEEARRVWNGHIDRRPAVIARCSGPADVLAAVRFARERELPVAVRGGGHAIAGHAVTDGGIVVDLSAMTAVRVDPLRGPPGSRAAVSTRTWTGRRRRSGLPPRAASSATRASPDSCSAAASGTCSAPSASPSTT